jgi:hypothetical protein
VASQHVLELQPQRLVDVVLVDQASRDLQSGLSLVHQQFFAEALAQVDVDGQDGFALEQGFFGLAVVQRNVAFVGGQVFA